MPVPNDLLRNLPFTSVTIVRMFRVQDLQEA